MKQLALLTILTVAGGFGALQTPFWGVLLYYSLAVSRPAQLWEWALPIHIRWSLIAALIVLGSIALNFSDFIKKLHFSLGMMILITFCGLLLLSCLNAHDPAEAQRWAIEFAKIMLMATIALILIDKYWQIRVIFLMILIVLGYIAWEMNFLYITQGRLDIYHHGFGGYDNNGGGTLIAMGVPFALAATISPSRALWQRGIAAILGLLMIHTVMMSYSRGAMLAACVGVIWTMVHLRNKSGAIIASVILFFLIAAMAGPEIRQEFYSTKNYESDTSAQLRFASWNAAWQIAWDHPITGRGIRNSNQASLGYGADLYGRTIHNQYLQIAADSGIIAALIYLTMLGTAVWSLRTSRHLCFAYVEQHQAQLSEATKDRVAEAGFIALAFEGGLMVFIAGAMFLSIEAFELPYLLIVCAHAMPAILTRRLKALDKHQNLKQQKREEHDSADQNLDNSPRDTHSEPSSFPPIVNNHRRLEAGQARHPDRHVPAKLSTPPVPH